MQKLLTFIFLINFILPVLAADSEVTIYVDDAYRPFSYKGENGEAKGMYIDVLHIAFSRMQGFKVTMKPVPWKRGKIMMKNGQGYALAPPYFHGHDWPYLYPYSLRLFTETVIVVCNEKVLNLPRPNWPQDYIGLSFGNVTGYDGWGGKAFHALVKQKKIAYQEAKGTSENIMKLALQRIDCILMENKTFDYELEHLKKRGIYITGKHAKLKKAAIIGDEGVYLGYSKTAIQKKKYPFHAEFSQAFDSEIYKMKKSGEINNIMNSFKE